MYKRTLSIILVTLLIFAIFFDLWASVTRDTSATDVSGGHISADTTWFKAGSPYMIKGDVIVDFGATLTIEPGVEVKFTDAYNLYIDGNLTTIGTSVNRITFTSGTGKPASRGDWKSIRINSTGRLRMNYCDVSYGDNSVYVYGSIDNIIQNSTVSESRRHGIYVRYSSNMIIKNTDIGPNNWNGVYFSSSSNSEVINCTSHSNSFEGITISDSSYINIVDSESYSNEVDGIHVFESLNVSIKNSKVSQNSNNGIGLKLSEHMVIDNCEIFSNDEDGIFLPDNYEIEIKNCTIYDHQNGIYLSNSSKISIENTLVHTNTESGITLMDSSFNTLDNIEIYSSGNYGIIMSKDPILNIGSSYNYIKNCDVSDNMYGILVRFSQNNNIENSHIYENTNGIIAQECGYINVTNNNISDNLYHGISFIGSSNGIIISNELDNNFYGIFLLAPSSNNLIHHNTIIGHAYYAYGWSPLNQWDDGSEGNYWGDYDGVDINIDGIGDEPYPINPIGEDRYPLVDFYNTRFKIISSIPSNESNLVQVTTSIKLTLSEGAIKQTFEGNITILPSTLILSYTWEDLDKNLTLALPQISYGELYIVTVNTNATGITGRSLQHPYILVFYTENPSDTIPPKVSDVFPTGSEVLTNTSIINITFNELMIHSATESAFSIYPDIPGEFSWVNNTLYFYPKWEFLDLTTYTITINGSTAKDAVGFTLDGDGDGIAEGSPIDDYLWSFKTTRYDIISPIINKVEPTGNMVDVNSPIKIYFSELMNKTSVEQAFSYTNGTVSWTSANGTWGRSVHIMTFIPSQPFNYSQIYTVTIRASARDWHDNTLDGNANGSSEGSPIDDYTWSFRTIYDPTKGLPTVNEIFPSGISVPLGTEIVMNFSQNMNQSSVEKSFVITDGIKVWDKSNGTFVWEENKSIFIPGFSLEYDTTYTVSLNITAKNIVGDQLDGNANGVPEDYTLDTYSWSFKTEAPAELIISYISVEGENAKDPTTIWHADAGKIIPIGVNITNIGYFPTGKSCKVTLYNLSGLGDPMNITVSSLDKGQDSGTITFSWPAPTSLGDHFVEIIVDWGNEISEVNENNNTFTLHFAVGPDYIPLNVTVNGLDASDPSKVWYVDLGVAVEIGVEAMNIGFSGVSSNINYSIAFWNSTSSGILLGSMPFELITGLSGLGVGESSGYQAAFWFIQKEIRDYYISIIIDYEGTTIEIDEGNNIFILHLALSPDYTIANVFVDGNDANDPSVSWNATAGQFINISVNATNLGLSGVGDSIQYNISFYNSTNRGTPLESPFYTISLPGLLSGENSGEVICLWLPPNKAGNHYVAIIIDPDNNLPENNEENNIFVLHFIIGPDLVPSKVVVNGLIITNSPSTPIYVGPGENVSIEVNASDLGFSGTGKDFNLALFNGTRKGEMQEQPYFNISVSKLSPFGSPGYDSGAVSAFWPTSLNPGLHYVIVYTDISGLCDESNEENNYWVLTFVISPNLIPNNITVDGQPISAYPNETVTIMPGQSILIGANASNIGDSSTGMIQFSIAYYNSTSQGANLEPSFVNWNLIGPLEKNGYTIDFYGLWQAPYPNKPTDYYINISVDSDFELSEIDEYNNYYILHIRVDAPDLTFDDLIIELMGVPVAEYTDPYGLIPPLTSDIPVEVPSGESLTLWVKVINLGGLGMLESSNVTFYNVSGVGGSAIDLPFWEATLPIINAGKEALIFGTWISPTIFGTYYINISIDFNGTLDIYGKIFELNELNNTFTLIINVTPIPVTIFYSPDPTLIYNTTIRYVTSNTELNFTVTGLNPPFITYYRIFNMTNGSYATDWINHTDPIAGGKFKLSWGEATYLIEFNSTDSMGALELTKYRFVIVDDSKPLSSINIGNPRYRDIGSDNWNISSITPITLNAIDYPLGLGFIGMSNSSGINNPDKIKSGIFYRIWSNDTSSWIGDWVEYTGQFYILGDDGTYTIYYNSTDNLGNMELPRMEIIYLDNTGPATNITIADPKYPHPIYDWFVISSTVYTLTAYEMNGSGSNLSTIQFKITYIDGMISSGWIKGNTFDIASSFIQEDGNYSIEFQSKDNLGNMQIIGTIYIQVDDSIPTIYLYIGEPKHRQFDTDRYNITYTTPINITGEDGPGCGISILSYRISNATNITGWIPYIGEFNFSGFGGGLYLIEYNGTDYLGNIAINSIEIYLDTEAPITTLSIGEPKHRSETSHSWNITSSTSLSLALLYENASGLAYLEYRISNSTNDTGWMLYGGNFNLQSSFIDGIYIIHYRGIDKLGNVENERTITVQLDNSGPKSNLTLGGPAYRENLNDVWNVSSITVFTKNGYDGNGSGIKVLWHRIFGNDTGFYYTGWLSGNSFVFNLVDGNYTIEFYGVDNLLNVGPIGHFYIYLDNKPPESFSSIGDPKYRLRPTDDWMVAKNTNITLQAHDNFGSGIEGIYYSIWDGTGNLVISSNLYALPFNVSGLGGDGQYIIRFWAKDNLNNSEFWNEIKLNLDSTSPKIMYTVPKGSGNSVTSYIEIIFSEEMNPDSVKDAFSYTDGYQTWNHEHGFINWNGKIMTFYPYENLSYGTYYTVTVNTTASDHVRNPLDGDADGIYEGEVDIYTWNFWTREKSDNDPPIIVNVLPSQNAQNVAINAVIVIEFNETMNEISVEEAFSYTDGDKTFSSIDGVFTWEGNKMTFTPFELFVYDTEYTVTISTLASDISGNPLETSYTWYFTTKGDDVPPKITAHSPSGENISVDTNITLTFNEVMNETSVKTAFIILPFINGSFEWIQNTLTFTPESSLKYGTTYYVYLGIEAKDAAGNSLEFPHQFNFTTEPDIYPPEVISHYPVGIDVDINVNITITFNEEMQHLSVEEAFSIDPQVEGIFSWTGNTLLFNPITLINDTTYTVTIGTEAKDLANNSLLSVYQFSFTTKKDPYPPYIIEVEPTGVDVPLDSFIRIKFSETMEMSSLYIAFKIEPYISGILSWENDTLIFRPNGKFAKNTIYNVTIEKNAKDLAGNYLVENYTWQFETGEGKKTTTSPFPWDVLFFWLFIVIISVMLVVICYVFIFKKRKKQKEDIIEEERDEMDYEEELVEDHEEEEIAEDKVGLEEELVEDHEEEEIAEDKVGYEEEFVEDHEEEEITEDKVGYEEEFVEDHEEEEIVEDKVDYEEELVEENLKKELEVGSEYEGGNMAEEIEGELEENGLYEKYNEEDVEKDKQGRRENKEEDKDR